MPEENTTQEAVSENNSGPSFNIKRIYLKDLSFETPMGAEAFGLKESPAIGQDINVQANKLDDKHHEVILLMTITAKVGDKVSFLIEVKQAGIFEITGAEGIKLGQAINSECPKILFPYIREVIDTTLVRGTFAALMLPQINFDAIFAKAMQDVQVRQQQENLGSMPA